MKVIVNGAAGRMGKVLCGLLQNPTHDAELVARVDCSGADGCYASLSDFTGEADVIIDFSHHAATESLLDYAKSRQLPVIVCTTGHSKSARNKRPRFHYSRIIN